MWFRLAQGQVKDGGKGSVESASAMTMKQVKFLSCYKKSNTQLIFPVVFGIGKLSGFVCEGGFFLVKVFMNEWEGLYTTSLLSFWDMKKLRIVCSDDQIKVIEKHFFVSPSLFNFY